MFMQVPEPAFFLQLELHPPGRGRLILVEPIYISITEDVSTFRVSVSNIALVHLLSYTSKANLTFQFPSHPSHLPGTIYSQRNQKYSAVLGTSKKPKNLWSNMHNFFTQKKK